MIRIINIIHVFRHLASGTHRHGKRRSQADKTSEVFSQDHSRQNQPEITSQAAG
jgi:hypothetical protein